MTSQRSQRLQRHSEYGAGFRPEVPPRGFSPRRSLPFRASPRSNSLPREGAEISRRAFRAERALVAAERLPVLSEQEVGFGQSLRSARQLRPDCFLHRFVRRAVVFLCAAVSHACEDAHSVPVERQIGADAAIEQDLLGAGVADIGKELESLLGLAYGSLRIRSRSPPNWAFVMRAISRQRKTRVSGRMPPIFASSSNTSWGAFQIASGVSPTWVRNPSKTAARRSSGSR